VSEQIGPRGFARSALNMWPLIACVRSSTEFRLRVHLLPLLGSKRLDAITNEDVQTIKQGLTHRSAETTNNACESRGPRCHGSSLRSAEGRAWRNSGEGPAAKQWGLQ